MPRGHSIAPSPPTSPVLHPSLMGALALTGVPELPLQHTFLDHHHHHNNNNNDNNNHDDDRDQHTLFLQANYSLSAPPTKLSPTQAQAYTTPLTPPTSPTRRSSLALPPHLSDEEYGPVNAAQLILRRRSSQAKEAKKVARAIARKEAKTGLRAALREDIRANFAVYDAMDGLFGELLEALNDVRAEKRCEELEKGGSARRRSSLAAGLGSPLMREWSQEGAVGAIEGI